MTAPTELEITLLLRAWGSGDEQALDKLTPLVYEQLHRVARRYMAGEHSGHVLQTTALVNEAYLRLFECRELNWQDRAHFFAVCAKLMRRILIDIARSTHYEKRGGGAPHVALNEALGASPQVSADIPSLEEALVSLTTLDARKGQVVELRFFGGLSVEETAEVLRVSKDTVARDWRLAKTWLLRELSERSHDGL
jgi:RNA polymerase sigma-70 factor (ECF subfamily)